MTLPWIIVISVAAGELIGWLAHHIYVHGLQHSWVETSRTYVPPQSGYDIQLVHLGGEARSLLFTGFTTVLFRCEHCNTLRSVKLAGAVHKPAVVPLRSVSGHR